MTDRYDSESLRARINRKLAAYSKSAEGFRGSARGASFSRTLVHGSLAAVVPLAAAAGVTRAQCTSGSPFGTVTLTGFATVPIGLGATDEFVKLLFDNGYPDLVLLGYGVDIFGVDLYASLFSASSSVTPQGSTGAFAFGCYSGTGGAFCQGSSGYVALQSNSDSRLGWLELGVTTLNTSQAVLTIGFRGMQNSPSSTIHPGDCSSLIVLPVELVSFEAITGNDGVALAWETASELNNAGFEIQRARQNGTFEKLTFIEGHGTTTDGNTYRYTDDTVEPNVYYRYRLKQIDFDGATAFSQIVEVFTEDPSQIALSEFYPNPANNGRATLQINVADDAEAAVELYDVRGALVESRSRMLNAGQNQLRFKTDGLAAGLHFAKISIGERVMYRQFVVAR